MSSIGETNEYLTFILSGEEYAIEVSKIESVLEYTKITPLPGTDDTIKGVINLRGRALPVVDLRMILNLDVKEITLDTSIVVMFIESQGEILTMGGLVDAVKEVIEILPENIQEAPKVGIRIKDTFIVGMAKKEDNFIIVLDIDKILNSDQMALAAEADKLALPQEEAGQTAAEEV
ncbi:chemotaxis protein CheW [Spirochaeta isovalerica]|uniref:Purine-binding chemotaxis protein CheW n=1 Tax=Spirochaeta isovalerica TaxID=150 RepID=A0A841R9V5_9SPIO|nr:chemotaxis protein CheW [Spirochaeta isovalerica]MBB6479488.1 purine-binding chemotaxis protein CheW [Spirochaeta isovalerica]